MFLPLNLPQFEIKIIQREGKVYVFDEFRKKNILLTPEEWVRQHFLHYLVNHLDYPKPLIKTEGGILYNRLAKRSDILVYDRQGEPFLLIECKAPDVKLDQKVVFQASTYNQTIKAPYLAVTNGINHFVFQLDAVSKQMTQMASFPLF